ncbi:preprotein translocase subunit SecY [Candidatus Mesenet endosymbiont of Agriotes lineatus]|uniref:preprotein translocase subunit SecY n=1 Tax=Candidatus Mesenet endosymbiont of Agriotes lineatus TaxID=3077948 RepID=UPI0030CD199D
MNSKDLLNKFDFSLLCKGDLLIRCLFTIGALIIYRLATYIPIPGVNLQLINDFFSRNSIGILGVFNLLSGGALGRMTILSLNIVPYVVSSIIIQLILATTKGMNEIKSNNELWRCRVNSYVRYVTIILCIIQGFAILLGLENMNTENNVVVLSPGFWFRVIGIFSLLGGTMFLVWLGEKINTNGIGNGISLIIFTGIISELHNALSSIFILNRAGSISIIMIFFIFLLFLLLLTLVIFVERSYRKIFVQYPRKQSKGGLYNDNHTYIPLKLNIAGVIPTIFANAIVLTPITIANFHKEYAWSDFILSNFSAGKVAYVVFYLMLMIFFSFFYTAFVFNPQEVADTLRKNGNFIPGKRPGSHTCSYLQYVVFRLTFFGSLYLCFICLIPEVIRYYYNIPLIFGGASLLIIVSVIMDTISQVQAHIFASRYDSFMKKSELVNL